MRFAYFLNSTPVAESLRKFLSVKKMWILCALGAYAGLVKAMQKLFFAYHTTRLLRKKHISLKAIL